jgi:hypothetical protein
MDHVVAMRVVERVRDLSRDPDRLIDAELFLAIEFVAQRLALDVRHDVIEEGVGFARVEQRKDMRVLEIGRRFDLLDKPLGAQDGREFGTEHFDRHLAVVPHVMREVHRCHPTSTDSPLDGVAGSEGSRESGGNLRHCRQR